MRRLSALGVLNPGLAYALSLAGLARVDASVSVLLWALEPVLILGIAVVVLRERVAVPVALCAGAALAGVVLVVFQPGHASALGVALTIAGVAACAVYTVLSSRFLIEATTVSVVFVQQVTALLFALVLLVGSLVLSTRRRSPVYRQPHGPAPSLRGRCTTELRSGSISPACAA